MAERENATLTLNSTVPPATVATAPAARITPTAPTARGAGRISSASGARRPVPRATAARSVSDGRRLQPDGVGGRGGGRGGAFPSLSPDHKAASWAVVQVQRGNADITTICK